MVLSYLWVEKYNVYGVAMAQIIGALVMIIWRYIVVKKIKPEFKINIVKSVLLTGVIVASSWLCRTGGLVHCVIVFAGVLVVVALLNINLIKAVLNGAKAILLKRKKVND